jgi:hypothetical protein
MKTFSKKILPAAVLLSLLAIALVPLTTSAKTPSVQSGDIQEKIPESLCEEVSHDLSRYIEGCEGKVTGLKKNRELCCLLDLIETIVDYVFIILIVLAGLMIIWGAFLFVTAAGQADKVNAARDRLIWALVGVGVALGARGLIRLIYTILT